MNISPDVAGDPTRKLEKISQFENGFFDEIEKIAIRTSALKHVWKARVKGLLRTKHPESLPRLGGFPMMDPGMAAIDPKVISKLLGKEVTPTPVRMIKLPRGGMYGLLERATRVDVQQNKEVLKGAIEMRRGFPSVMTPSFKQVYKGLTGIIKKKERLLQELRRLTPKQKEHLNRIGEIHETMEFPAAARRGFPVISSHAPGVLGSEKRLMSKLEGPDADALRRVMREVRRAWEPRPPAIPLTGRQLKSLTKKDPGVLRSLEYRL